MDPTDIELGIPQEGYPALADWISADPDGETLIYRKFDRLSARYLLYQQAQLFALEAQLDEVEREMCYSADVTRRESLRRWETFIVHAQDPKRPEHRLDALLEKIETKLTAYRTSGPYLSTCRTN